MTVKLQWSIRLSFLVIPAQASDAISIAPTSKLAHTRRPSDHNTTNPAAPAMHARSRSFAFGTEPTPISDPVPVSTGPSHLMPILAESSELQISYRGVPDLAFRPVLFQSAEEARAMGSPSLHQRGSSNPSASPSNFAWSQQAPREVHGSVVLMPAKSEVIECSIPIKCYPARMFSFSCSPLTGLIL